MVWVATAIAGSSLLGAYSANNAANAQSTAANNALAFNNKMFNTVNSNEAPYLQNGAQASQQLSAMMPQLTSSFTNADLNANLAPNYAFMLGQGQGQVQNAMDATGGLVSGNTLQGLNTFTQDYAQNAYQNAFNNWQTNNSNIYNRLSGIAGIGINAGNTVAGVANNSANNASSLYGYQGNAQANGLNNMANSISGGANTYAGYNYLKSMNPNNSPTSMNPNNSPGPG